MSEQLAAERPPPEPLQLVIARVLVRRFGVVACVEPIACTSSRLEASIERLSGSIKRLTSMPAAMSRSQVSASSSVAPATFRPPSVVCSSRFSASDAVGANRQGDLQHLLRRGHPGSSRLNGLTHDAQVAILDVADPLEVDRNLRFPPARP